LFGLGFALGKIGPGEWFELSLQIVLTLAFLFFRRRVPPPGSRGAYNFGSFVILLSGSYAFFHILHYPNENHGRASVESYLDLLMFFGRYIRGDAYKGQ
jgi:hypothetical protein